MTSDLRRLAELVAQGDTVSAHPNEAIRAVWMRDRWPSVAAEVRALLESRAVSVDPPPVLDLPASVTVDPPRASRR